MFDFRGAGFSVQSHDILYKRVSGHALHSARLQRLRKKYVLSSRAKRGICFSSRLPTNSRFLGQTPPFGMTWCEFFRSLFNRAVTTAESMRLEPLARSKSSSHTDSQARAPKNPKPTP